MRFAARSGKLDAAVQFSEARKMKALLISALIAAVAGGAEAQTDCQPGVFTACNGDGMASTSQHVGDLRSTAYRSGMTSTSQQIGNQTYTSYSNGMNAASQQVGQLRSTTYSNGVTSTTQRIGNSTYTHYSDGTTVTCQYIGNQRYCS
jgi:hypothetical protein